MAFYRSPLVAAEPYEESSGIQQVPPSAEEYRAYYQQMETQEIVQRKLSKRTGTASSIWSRKTVKRATTTAPSAQQPQQLPQNLRPSLSSSPEADSRLGPPARDEQEKEMEKLEVQNARPDPMNSPRSILPDTLREAPTWYTKETWASVPHPAYRMKYNIHNPVGPRWYKNWHLIPPAQLRPAVRPPSVFSPSFPPMASATAHDRSEDTTRLAGPSRTPSNSPLPTPTSSQTRVADAANKPRSRKTSQTAQDDVDMMDVTDPWGTNWHHQSPYDIGIVSSEQHEGANTRSRRSSMSNMQAKRRTMPSPLSQSTSAVHLQAPGPTIHMPRKLSKRRTPGLGNIFGQPKTHGRQSSSAPPTPIDHGMQNPMDSLSQDRMHHIMRHNSSNSQSSKKEKRGSVLGRLAKKFSLLRKSAEPEPNWHQTTAPQFEINESDNQLRMTPSPTKQSTDPSKRVPPPMHEVPPLEPELGPEPGPEPEPEFSPPFVQEPDRSSYVSLDEPYSMGRLTVANPDLPTTDDETPFHAGVPLPPEKPSKEQRRSVEQPSPVSKPPTPPTPPPRSANVINDARASMEIKSTRPVSSFHREQGMASSIASPPPQDPRFLLAQSFMSGSSKDDFATAILSSLASSFQSPATSPPPSVASQRPSAMQSPQQYSRPRSQTQPHIKMPPPPPQPLQQSFLRSPEPQPAPRPSSHRYSYQQPHPHHASNSIPFAADYSPLSVASLIVNPPTPYAAERQISSSPEPPPPPPKLPAKEERRSLRDTQPNSPNTSTPTRQTETFKLRLANSNTFYPSNEAITAAGQQWEVVGSVKSKPKSNGKSQDGSVRKDSRRAERQERSERSERADRPPERPERQEKYERQERPERSERPRREDHPEKLEKVKVETHSQEQRSRTKSHSHKPSRVEPPPEVPRDRGHHASPTKSPGHHRSHERDTSSSSRQAEPKPAKRERRSSERKSMDNPNFNKPQPPPPPPVAAAPAQTRPLERNNSISNRPTSELPSAADLNALRAKEAWEMERLWKARSMYGVEPNGIASTFSVPSETGSPTKDARNYGSSHTAFHVSSPFHSIPPHIYHNAPSINSLSSIYDPSNSSSHRAGATTNGSSTSSSTTNPDPRRLPPTHPLLLNPLPDPPRHSAYESAPNSFLSPSLRAMASPGQGIQALR